MSKDWLGFSIKDLLQHLESFFNTRTEYKDKDFIVLEKYLADVISSDRRQELSNTAKVGSLSIYMYVSIYQLSICLYLFIYLLSVLSYISPPKLFLSLLLCFRISPVPWCWPWRRLATHTTGSCLFFYLYINPSMYINITDFIYLFLYFYLSINLFVYLSIYLLQ